MDQAGQPFEGGPAAQQDRETDVAAQERKGIHPAWGILVGPLAVGLGLLPWLLTGARLPLQNLWVGGGQEAFSFLPLSQYSLTAVVAFSVVPGLFAALAWGLLWGSSPGGKSARQAISVFMGIVQIIVALQSISVLASGHDVGGAGTRAGYATFYVTALTAWTVACAVLGQLVFWLAARTAAWPRAVGLILTVLPLRWWFLSWMGFLPLAEFSQSPWLQWLSRWMPALVLGAALGFIGWRPARLLWAWVAGAVLVWFGEAAAFALAYVAGTRSMLYNPRGAADAGLQAFLAMLGPVGGSLTQALVGLAIGGLLALVLSLTRARRHARLA